LCIETKMSTPEEQRFLLECWDQNVCPHCNKQIPEGTRVGSGKKSEGGFCSLNCYGEYHKKALIARHKQRTESEQKNQN